MRGGSANSNLNAAICVLLYANDLKAWTHPVMSKIAWREGKNSYHAFKKSWLKNQQKHRWR